MGKTRDPKRFSGRYRRNKVLIKNNRGGVEDTRLEAKAKAKDTKKSEAKAKAKDSLSEDRHSRGQGQECSRPRPRTQSASALQKKKVFTKIFQAISKKKKRSSQIFFKRSPLKNVFQKIFQALHKILTFQKIVLSSSRGQANFRGLEASRPRQGQGLQNVSSRTSSRPRTSSRTPPLKNNTVTQTFVIH